MQSELTRRSADNTGNSKQLRKHRISIAAKAPSTANVIKEMTGEAKNGERYEKEQRGKIYCSMHSGVDDRVNGKLLIEHTELSIGNDGACRSWLLRCRQPAPLREVLSGEK